jgi:hypothetical protein
MSTTQASFIWIEASGDLLAAALLGHDECRKKGLRLKDDSSSK